jgi:hypothetical protein
MADDAKLTPVDPADLADALAFALRYDGRKRSHQGDEFMARITAERLVEHLTKSRFVIMQRPPLPRHSTSGGPTTRRE